jgi:hypothetical protein
MRNSNESRERRGSSDERKPQWRPYLDYLNRLADRRAEQVDDLEAEENYWRTRERLNTERQSYKRAA